MIDRQQLLKDLQRELPKLEKDILAYSEQSAERTAHLKQEYAKAKEAGRTAEHFVSWREVQITQAAVAWVLTCVFVRFLEDNGLLAQPVLAGPVEREGGQNSTKSHPLKNAKDRIEAYFNEHPTHAEREYLLHLFEQLEQIPVIAELLDHRHNPLWQIPVSADGAKSLIDFFQKIDPETGQIIHDFTDPKWDTRFLGDLYQDLSEAVRKRYALLQTPEFVESFILDYTLEPAILTFGLEGLHLIDPTCGSGHFLLTTFERIFERWQKREPGTNSRVLAQRALDVVHGVDINPYAIAICRFRLLMAAMKNCDIELIKDAPAFRFNLACGDSLLHGRRFEWQGQGIQQGLLDDELKHVFETEDVEKLNKILGQQYHVVVGNPPYIRASEKASNQAYRKRFLTCHKKYSLGVPFTERFFDLTLNRENLHEAGFVGMITTNSFMKREFGIKLIEEFLPNRDVTHILDTSGAKIPGHRTPTLIMFARNRSPTLDYVRVLEGIRGEPTEPKDHSKGKVWTSLLALINKPNEEDRYFSSVDLARNELASHPWSLLGGGARDAFKALGENCNVKIGDLTDEIGFGCITGEEDLYVGERHNFNAAKIPKELTRIFVQGDSVRNWRIDSEVLCIFPYDQETILPRHDISVKKYLWSGRTKLRQRMYFGKTQDERSLNWFEYGYISRSKCASKYLITYPFVSTHNHFVLDRGEKAFKQTAPVIKLPDVFDENDYLSLQGLLNSSIACFWARQIFFPKGGFSSGKWEERLEWDGTKLKRFPIPDSVISKTSNSSSSLTDYREIVTISSKIDELASRLSSLMPSNNLGAISRSDLDELFLSNRTEGEEIYGQMVVLQEELDWHCYRAYGLIDNTPVYTGNLPSIKPGQRAFEISLLRDDEQEESSEEWFARHNYCRDKDFPKNWTNEYIEVVNKRLELIEAERFIKLIEKPEYKRRWFPIYWEELETKALREWLLSFIEACLSGQGSLMLTTCAQLIDIVEADDTAKRVVFWLSGKEDYDMRSVVLSLIQDQHVPQMAASRFSSKAVEKYRAWQEVWAKQREEDEIDREFDGQDVLSVVEKSDRTLDADQANISMANQEKLRRVGKFSLPPQYGKTDYRSPSFYSIREKLDTPKERFFSLPGCEKDGDNTLVIGWAGLNHLQRAQAIAAWYEDRKENDGWEAGRLMPMLVAIDELIPWLKQWHNDIDPEYGERMGDFYESYLLEELRRWELTREELLDWRPPAATKRRRS